MVLSLSLLVFIAILSGLGAGFWLVWRSSAKRHAGTDSPRCPACGEASIGAANFCGHCGHRLT